MVNLPFHRVLLFSLLVILTGLGYWNEKIPVNNHTGWDGKHYANLTIHFEELAVQKQIDAYQYQRILTPAVIYYTAKLLGIPLHTENIVTVFYLYNSILLLTCALLFFNLCSFLKLNSATEIIGFSGLFLNYFVLKNTSYYPVLTDTTAYFMGFCIILFFFRQKDTLLLLTVLIGQFCYPMFLVVSTPLALGIRNNSITNTLKRFALFKVLAGVLIVLLLVGFYRIFFVADTIIPRYKMELNSYLLPLSILLVTIYSWKMFTAFEQVHTIPSSGLNLKIPFFKTLAVCVFATLTTYGVKQISIPEDVFTPMVFIYNVLQQSIDNPLVFLVAHIIYLGPVLVLLVFFYRSFIQTLAGLGDSAIVYFMFVLVFSIGSETRQFIHFFPFVVVVLLITLNRYEMTQQNALLFAGLSLLVSKCWLNINTPGSFTQYAYAQFPDQYYFMNHGPFMSDLSYIINTGIVLLEIACVWFIFRLKLRIL
jgi:hypothetical protein